MEDVREGIVRRRRTYKETISQVSWYGGNYDNRTYIPTF